MDCELADIVDQGLTKPERILLSAQGARVRVQTSQGVREVLNLCANNYLGLASDVRVVEVACEAARRCPTHSSPRDLHNDP